MPTELIILFGVIYFLPTIIALAKNHSRKWDVFVVSVLGGFTGIGWIIGFVGAVWDS